VARDPALAQEISNGHAARMRYSRFKKQMDGTAGVKKPRNPASPRKPKAEKKTSPKKVKEFKDENADSIKRENGSQEPHFTEGTPEAASAGLGLGVPPSTLQHISQCNSSLPHYSTPIPESSVVKKEPGLAQYPMTPGSQNQSPSPDFHGASQLSDMDDMMALSFGMPYDGHGNGYGMMMPDPFQELWQQQQQQQHQQQPHSPQVGADGEVLVKREERWDDAYDNAHA
jgi:hypothetical protein